MSRGNPEASAASVVILMTLFAGAASPDDDRHGSCVCSTRPGIQSKSNRPPGPNRHNGNASCSMVTLARRLATAFSAIYVVLPAPNEAEPLTMVEGAPPHLDDSHGKPASSGSQTMTLRPTI